MSKAVLVMDMPSSCDECHLLLVGRYCKAKEAPNVAVDSKLNKNKPDWCPLRELPEKKVLSGDVADIQKMGKELIDIGYNACIDELLKGEEE